MQFISDHRCLERQLLAGCRDGIHVLKTFRRCDVQLVIITVFFVSPFVASFRTRDIGECVVCLLSEVIPRAKCIWRSLVLESARVVRSLTDVSVPSRPSH